MAGFKIFIIFLFSGLAIGPLVAPATAAATSQKKKTVVKIKLVKCSKTSGGMYREGPQKMPLCGPVGGRFLILGDCKNKYDHRTCKQVQKKNSKTGLSEARLAAGIYHFVWDITSPELRERGPCSVRIDDAYDVEVQSPNQEVRLAIDVHCAAP